MLFVWILPASYLSGHIPVYLIYFLVIIAGIYFSVISPKIHNDTFQDKGIGSKKHLFIKTDAIKGDLLLYGKFVLVCSGVMCVVIFIKSSQTGLGVNWSSFFLKYILYIFSATIQDVLFFSLLLLRLKYIVGNHLSSSSELGRQASTTFFLAIAFGLAHYPNWPLVLVTFFFFFGLSWVFYTRPNLFLVIMCHAFFGAVLHRIVMLHMKFGIF